MSDWTLSVKVHHAHEAGFNYISVTDYLRNDHALKNTAAAVAAYTVDVVLPNKPQKILFRVPIVVLVLLIL